VKQSQQEQKQAEMFFREESKHQQAVQQQFDSLPEEKKSRIAPLLARRESSNDNAVF
jgi:hypothetical protein